MPNKKGGKKYKKGGKKNIQAEQQLILKDKDQFEEYAYVKKKSGNGRFVVQCYDNIERTAVISGKMRKRVWIEVNDIVLIVKWEFQDEKCNIIHKYDQTSVDKLITKKEIISSFIQNNNQENEFKLDDFYPSDSDSESESESDLEINEEFLQSKPDNDKIDIDDI